MSIQLVMPSHHLILCRRLLLLPSDFPSIGVFLVSQLFSSGSQRLGASASALPLAGEAKQEVESQCAGPGRAYGAAAAVSSEIQEQDSPMCKVASDRPSLSDHHPGLILRLWPERPVSSVGNLAGLRDCLPPVRGPLEMRAEQASARCSRNPGAGLQTLAVGAGTHTEAGGRGGRACIPATSRAQSSSPGSPPAGCEPRQCPSSPSLPRDALQGAPSGARPGPRPPPAAWVSLLSGGIIAASCSGSGTEKITPRATVFSN